MPGHGAISLSKHTKRPQYVLHLQLNPILPHLLPSQTATPNLTDPARYPSQQKSLRQNQRRHAEADDRRAEQARLRSLKMDLEARRGAGSVTRRASDGAAILLDEGCGPEESGTCVSHRDVLSHLRRALYI